MLSVEQFVDHIRDIRWRTRKLHIYLFDGNWFISGPDFCSGPWTWADVRTAAKAEVRRRA